MKELPDPFKDVPETDEERAVIDRMMLRAISLAPDAVAPRRSYMRNMYRSSPPILRTSFEADVERDPLMLDAPPKSTAEMLALPDGTWWVGELNMDLEGRGNRIRHRGRVTVTKRGNYTITMIDD